MGSLGFLTPTTYRRAAWGAAHGLGHLNKRIRSLVVIHHTHAPVASSGDSLEATAEVVRRIERFHAIERMFKGIAYHWLVDQNGRIWEGRGWFHTGAHVAGRNTESIGIAGIIRGGQSSPSPAMLESIRYLIERGKYLSAIHPNAEIHPHSHFTSTACPGMKMKDWLPDMDPKELWTDLSLSLIPREN